MFLRNFYWITLRHIPANSNLHCPNVFCCFMLEALSRFKKVIFYKSFLHLRLHGLRTLSNFGTLKNTAFRKLDLFPSSYEGGGEIRLICWVHWTAYIWLTTAIIPAVSGGRCP
jgi:hypothetical protein